MKKNLNINTDVYANLEYFIIPKNSFICTFERPFLNRQQNRVAHAAVAFNSANIFKSHEYFNEQIFNYYNDNIIIFLVFPGSEAFSDENPERFVKKSSNFAIKFTNVKDLGKYCFDSININVIYIFVNFKN